MTDPAQWRTAGEALARRELKRVKVRGVDHFAVGQYGCFVENDIAYVTFVNPMGHVVNIPFERDGERWKPLGVAQQAGQYTVDPVRPLPENWKPSEAVLGTLLRETLEQEGRT